MADDRKLADFRIDREISRSSIASIYQGYQETLDRKVLIKSLHPQLLGDKEIRTRFEREAYALARIKHKNIVHIYDYKADEHQAVLVSEWIDGGSVEEFSKKHGPFDEVEAVALTLSVLEGLAVAHAKGVIHRDIKPDNLLISSNGVIKITDFGLAQFEGSPSVTQQGVTMGTPAYIAPELVSGQPADQRSDLYNLGVTIYELLTGSNPFQASNLSQTLNNVTSVHPEPLSGIHSNFNDLLMSLMAKSPNRRPATANAALDVIRPLANELGIKRGWEDVYDPEEGEEGNGDKPPRTETRVRTTIQPIQRKRPSFGIVVFAIMIMASIPIIILYYNQAKNTGVPETSFPDSSVVTIQDSVISTPPAEVSTQPPTTTTQQTTQNTPVENEAVEPENHRPESDGFKTDPISTPPTEMENEPEVANEDETPSESTEVALTGSGYIYLHIRPWANVYINNEFIIQTPYNKAVELPVGKVTLSLINPQFPIIQHEVTITPGDTSSIRIDLFEKVGTVEFIDATPWAEIYIDDDYYGRTPLGKPVYLIPGKHTLILRHPSYPDNITEFEVVRGQTPLRFRKNMVE